MNIKIIMNMNVYLLKVSMVQSRVSCFDCIDLGVAASGKHFNKIRFIGTSSAETVRNESKKPCTGDERK